MLGVVLNSTIELIKSSHQYMRATIQLYGTLLEDIDYGLRQGCCIAPALFNLYSCLLLVVERWIVRTDSVEGVGVLMRHKRLMANYPGDTYAMHVNCA